MNGKVLLSTLSSTTFVAILAVAATAAAGPPDIVWEQYGHPGGAEAAAYSPDGQTIASGGDGSSGDIKLWGAHDGEPLGTITVGGDGIRSVDFNPGGDLIAVGTLVNGYPPGGVAEVRRVEDGELLFTLGGCFTAISPTRERVAGGGGGVNRYVDVRTLPYGTSVASFHHGAYIHDVTWHPDGVHVASAGSDNEVHLWNVEEQTLVRSFGPHENDVSSIAFSSDGTLLAAGEGGWDEYPAGSAIRIWRVADGELMHTLEGHGVWTYDVAFSPDGQTIISAGRDHNTPLRLSIRLWRVTGGPPFEEYDEEVSGGVLSILFDPEGDAFAYARGDGDVIVANYEGTTAAITADAPNLRAAILSPPSPNPLFSDTSIRFQLHRDGPVAVRVHDVTGRRVATLAEGPFAAGEHEVKWEGQARAGHLVSQGIYFVSLTADGETEVQRLVVSR